MPGFVPNEAPKMFGVYVKNVSTSIGWGGQGGSCQMTLVEQPNEGIQILRPVFQGEDPLNSPAVGTAVGFAYGGFSFGGILQRYTYKESLSEFTFDIVLESPGKLLDGIQVILDEFQGTVFDGSNPFLPSEGIIFDKSFDDYLHNIWNPFAELENFERGGIFGGAYTNSVGFPVGLLFEQLQKFGQGEGNFGGNITFGDSEYLIDFTEIIDAINATFGELEPKYQYRIKGPVQSLNGILGDICETMQYDYFAQIIGDHENGGIENPTIKIRALNRQSQPQPGVIRQFVADSSAKGNLISSNVGEEMQDVVTQRLVVGGAASRYYAAPVWYGESSTGSIYTYPVYGKIGDNAWVLGSGPLSTITSWANEIPVLYPHNAEQQKRITPNWPWAISGAALGGGTTPYWMREGGRGAFELPRAQAFYTAWLFELRMALGGQKTWEAFKVFQTAAGVEPNGFSYGDGTWPQASFYFTPPWHGSNTVGNNLLLQALVNFRRLAAGSGSTFIADSIDITESSAWNAVNQQSAQAKQFTKDLYDSVYKVATEFYGQVFLTPLPFEPPGERSGSDGVWNTGDDLNNNIRFLAEDYQYEAPWENADSAWTDFNGIRDVSFYDGEGKLKAAAQWPMKPNYNRFGTNFQGDYYNLGSDYGFDRNGNIYSTKGGPDKDITWIGGRPWAIIRSGAQVYEHDTVTTPVAGGGVLAQMFFGNMSPQGWSTLGGWNQAVDITAAMVGPGSLGNANNSGSAGAGIYSLGIPPAVMLPAKIGVPQVSNRYKWGPWYAYSSKKGKAEVVMDESLKPETFGSRAALDQAARAQTYSGLPSMSAVESGSVEIAEFPEFNVGDRFAAVGPYVTNLDISIDIGGCKTTYKFNTWTPNFGKLTKYNIDRIARINKSSLAFLQRERGKVTKQGFPRLQMGNMVTPFAGLQTIDYSKFGQGSGDVFVGLIRYFNDPL